jgi:hypothetical protein
MIRITAKYADGINASGDLENIENILRILLPALEHNSKGVKDFFISGFAPSIQLLKDEKEYKETLRNLAKQGINPDKSRKYGWIGTPEALIEKWRKAVDMGMTMSVIQVKPSKNHEENKEMLTKFKDEVATQI